MVTHRELERLSFMTRRFNQLQGLRCGVPIGLISLVPGLASFWIERLPITTLSLQILFTAAAFWLMVRGKAYYAARVGVVEGAPPHPDALRQLSVYSSGGGQLQVLVADYYPNRVRAFWVIAATVAASIGLVVYHVSFLTIATGMYLVLACGLFATWWESREHRADQAYYAVLGVVFLAIACRGDALGLLEPSVVSLHMAQTLTGAGLILCGVLDHWQLMHYFGPGAAAAGGAARPADGSR